MSAEDRPSFTGGGNIAMKLPPDLFAGTVSFYCDRLRLPVLEETDENVVFAFGSQKLWLDRAAGLSRPEIWLELVTDDLEGAAEILVNSLAGDAEPLPQGFEGFWITNPAGVVHLVSKK